MSSLNGWLSMSKKQWNVRLFVKIDRRATDQFLDQSILPIGSRG